MHHLCCRCWLVRRRKLKTSIIEAVAIRNVEQCVEKILRESQTIRRLSDEGKVAVVGAIFDITTGRINFLREQAVVAALTTLCGADIRLMADQLRTRMAGWKPTPHVDPFGTTFGIRTSGIFVNHWLINSSGVSLSGRSI